MRGGKTLLATVATIALATMAVPTAGATNPSEGELAWVGTANVTGVMGSSFDQPAYYRQAFSPGAYPVGYQWTWLAPELEVVVHEHEENELPFDAAAIGGPGAHSEWSRQRHQVDEATVTVTLVPDEVAGAVAVVYAAEPSQATFLASTPSMREASVRTAGPVGPAFTPPGEAGGAGSSVALVPDQLLAVDGQFDVVGEGDLRASLYGYHIRIDSPTLEESIVIKTGGERRYNAATGLVESTRWTYATATAPASTFEAGHTSRPGTLYTPLLQYMGQAEYPLGVWISRGGPEPGNSDDGMLQVNGNVWLSTLDQSSAEGGVRAWGHLDGVGTDAVASDESSGLPAAQGWGSAAWAAAAVGTLAASAGAPVFARWAAALGATLYARVSPTDPDENPTRRKILQLIRERPGTNLSTITKDMDIGWGTGAYHTQLLLRQGRIRQARVLNRVCFFPLGQHGQQRQVQTVLLQQHNYQSVMRVLSSSPGLSQREVADRTGHARQYVSRLMGKLERADLVRTEPGRAGRRYYPLTAPTFPSVRGPTDGFGGTDDARVGAESL